MRVVVGKAMKNQTPVLMATMSYIDFSPYWNVPYNIVKDEIIPKLARNPGFLSKENMELVSSNGVARFSGSTLAQLKQGTLRVRQRPGKKNALGRVKFLFPNKEDVYLHDTPSNSLFSRSRRDFSHGCVRVANPEGLAEFALKNQKGWNKDRIQRAMRNPKTQRVILSKPIPVLFFYSTAFFDEKHNLVFYPDIYGHDPALLEALKNQEDIPDKVLFVSEPPTPAPDTNSTMPQPLVVDAVKTQNTVKQ
jgi:murein L,D-transpeptidase YcbB/YkuD